MKKLLIILTIVGCGGYLYAQDQNVDAAIRSLEQIEVQAVLEKDTVTLRRIWDKNLIVNSPENRVVLSTANPADRPVMTKARLSFTRQVEQILVRGNTAISMGSETLIPAGDQSQSGQPVKRRYTNIWEKQEGSWKLVARHASIVCQPN